MQPQTIYGVWKCKELQAFCIPELIQILNNHGMQSNSFEITITRQTFESIIAAVTTSQVEQLVNALEQCSLLSVALKTLASKPTLEDTLSAAEELLPSCINSVKAISLMATDARKRKEKYLQETVITHLGERFPTAANNIDNSKQLCVVQVDENEYILGIQLTNGISIPRTNTPLAPTAMLPGLAHLTAVFARVGPKHSVYDPCCGSGSLLSASKRLGASYILGSDADPSYIPAVNSSRDHLIADVRSICVGEERFDAIVCDPPYGQRALVVTEVYGLNALENCGEDKALATTISNEFKSIMRSVIQVASNALLPGGRLACWLPHDSIVSWKELQITKNLPVKVPHWLDALVTQCSMTIVFYLPETRTSGLPRALLVCQRPGSLARCIIRDNAIRIQDRDESNVLDASRRSVSWKVARKQSQGTDVDIWRASWLGDVAMVQSFINAGGDINAKDEKKKTTPLQYAAGYNQLAVVELLIHAGADACAADDSQGMCALTRAAARGHATIVNTLLAQSNANLRQVCRKGQTALHYAAQFGHIEAVKALLHHDGSPAEAKALIQIHDNDGYTCLHVAAQWGMASVVEFIVLSAFSSGEEEKIDPNMRSSFESGGLTAGHLAARWGHAHVLKILYEAGADLKQLKCQRTVARTVYEEAVEWQRQQCIDYILSLN